MTDGRIGVLIVDDHVVVRDGLSAILSRCSDLEVLGAASNGEEALALVAELQPDVVLLDLEMPGTHGLEVMQALHERQPGTRVLILTAHDDSQLVLAAVRGGAHGYVLKSAARDELLAAIRHVAAGGQRFDEVVVKVLLAEEQRGDSRPTERELQVLQLVAAGLTNKEIAERLYVSVGTVKGHLDELYRKLGVADRAHAVAQGLRLGLLD